MTITITGNTFAAKNEIKALGGRWDADRKCWTIDARQHDTMRGRSALSNALHALGKAGCKITRS